MRTKETEEGHTRYNVSKSTNLARAYIRGPKAFIHYPNENYLKAEKYFPDYKIV